MTGASAQAPTNSRARRTFSTRARMAAMLIALAPGVAVQGWLFGTGALRQLTMALVFALAVETVCLRLRGQALKPFLSDLTAPISAVLFAAFMPPQAPWWVAATGMIAAIGVGKQLYGGLGRNLFNPAMVGVATVTLGFALDDQVSWALCSPGAYWLALAYAAGGLGLVALGIVPWQTPVSVLGGAAVMIAVFSDGRISTALSTEFSSGSLLLAAFFIASDPVTGCHTARGRIVFGLGVGLVTLLIRQLSAQPDGVALAVLTMNALARGLDQRWRVAQ